MLNHKFRDARENDSMRQSAHRYSKKLSALLVLPFAAMLALSACSDENNATDEDVNITPKNDASTEAGTPVESDDVNGSDDLNGFDGGDESDDVNGLEDVDALDESGGVAESSFVIEQGGVETTMTYTAKGDRVTKQSTVNEIDYAAAGLASEEEAKEILDPVVEASQGVAGLEHTIDYRGDTATESMSVDYEVASLSELAEVPGYEMNSDEVDDDTYISMKVSREELINAGFEEVQ